MNIVEENNLFKVVFDNGDELVFDSREDAQNYINTYDPLDPAVHNSGG
jgi:hypothetical protein